MAFRRFRNTQRRPIQGRRRVVRTRHRRVMRTRRSRVPKRAILNLVSRKKRDAMAGLSQTAGTQNNGPLVMTANTTNSGFGVFVVPWVPTARDFFVNPSGNHSDINDQSTRTAQRCFIRGVQERIRMYTSTSLPWEWRRIVFAFKGTAIMLPIGSAFTPYYADSSSGWRRYALNLTATTSTSDQIASANNLLGFMFRGRIGQDYFDPLTAITDTNIVKIMSDRTRRIASSNNSGTQKVYKLWHPVNKTLVYSDSEDGDEEDAGFLSTPGRPGCGDIYVVDIFKPHPSASTDILSFGPEASLFWHER
ncbi:capsid protein [Blackbird associated gemykibivirus 1]|uniref:Capsid protein n=1 Tax=Blackbird associated gemykibivirus 1 TaxID=1391038 RepID=T1YRX2_9VIRU|nr:capsid protein [Blackbird associated gemykibivirus 1]AGU67652.1 capsid protein [Blackbird associated gemykibivirus 1]